MAVKKDRAVENLLNGGSQFVVNILAEENHKGLMKQLLKSFKPGEDRFAGLDIQVGLNCHNSTYESAEKPIGLCQKRHYLSKKSKINIHC